MRFASWLPWRQQQQREVEQQPPRAQVVIAKPVHAASVRAPRSNASSTIAAKLLTYVFLTYVQEASTPNLVGVDTVVAVQSKIHAPPGATPAPTPKRMADDSIIEYATWQRYKLTHVHFMVRATWRGWPNASWLISRALFLLQAWATETGRHFELEDGIIDGHAIQYPVVVDATGEPMMAETTPFLLWYAEHPHCDVSGSSGPRCSDEIR